MVDRRTNREPLLARLIPQGPATLITRAIVRPQDAGHGADRVSVAHAQAGRVFAAMSGVRRSIDLGVSPYIPIAASGVDQQRASLAMFFDLPLKVAQ